MKLPLPAIERLATLAFAIGVRAPVPKPSTAHNIYVTIPVRMVHQIRAILEAEGVDWKAEARDYQRRVRKARKESKGVNLL